MHEQKKTWVDSAYLSLELRGDRFDSNAVHHYLPERLADGAFKIPARPGPNNVTVFVDLGRVLPGTVEIETDAPEGTEIEFGLGEALAPLRFYRADTSADGCRRVFRPAIAQAGWTGLRYAWIRFCGARTPFMVQAVHGVMQLMDAPRLAEFECSDKGYGLFFDWDERVITRHGVQPAQRPELEACFTGKHVQFLRELARAADWLGNAKSATVFAEVAQQRGRAWRDANPGPG